MAGRHVSAPDSLPVTGRAAHAVPRAGRLRLRTEPRTPRCLTTVDSMTTMAAMTLSEAERTAVFGLYPGGRMLGPDHLASVTEVMNARSLYRLYGLDPQHKCLTAERLLSQFVGTANALVVSSGTAALHVGLRAAGVGPGDEVILPAYGWISDLMAVLALEAVPVVVGVDQTLGLSASEVTAALTDRTRAVIGIHMRGYPCDVPSLRAAVAGHGALVIEDCSQAFGARIHGQPVGGLADLATFSFQFNKLLTSGEGGAVTTSDDSTYERARWFHDCGMLRAFAKANPLGGGSLHGIGVNYRMSELAAAVLVPQLEPSYISDLIGRLERSWSTAVSYLDPLISSGLIQLRPVVDGGVPNYAFLGFRLMDDATPEHLASELTRLGLPAAECTALRDPHHATVWTEFMVRESIPFRDLRTPQAEAEMARTFLFDIIPSLA